MNQTMGPNLGTGAGGQSNSGASTGTQGNGSAGSAGSAEGGAGAAAGTGAGNAALNNLVTGQEGGGTGDAGNGTGGTTGTETGSLTIEQQLENEKGRSRQLQLAAREQEKRAKQGAAAVKRLEEIEQASMTELQKAQAQVLANAQAAAEANAEVFRLRASAKHNIPVEMIEFLGEGTEEQIDTRAQDLAKQIQLQAAAIAAAGAQNQGGLPGIGQGGNAGFPRTRPAESLQPGGTPSSQPGANTAESALRGFIGNR
jgi:hypothetical protein